MSDSVKYAQSAQFSIQQVYVAFVAHSDLCLSFLQQCADYGEKVSTWSRPYATFPTFSRVGAPPDLLERSMRLRSEMTGVSVESTPSVPGLSSYQLTPFDVFL